MSEWSDGYRAALQDVARLGHERGLALPSGFVPLLDDLAGDALVIERQQSNRMQRRRLAAAREATLPFDEPPP